MRARSVLASFSGVFRSIRARFSFHDPTSSSTLPWNSVAEARLRTRLTAPEGSPAPLVRPVAPRTSSTWSYIDRLVKISPELHGCSQVVGTPSIISELSSKPRETNWPRLVSYWFTEKPVVFFTTSVMVRMPWSAICCWVTTDMDCGVSRGLRFSGVAVALSRMV